MYQIIEDCSDFVLIDKMPGFALHKDQEESGLAMQLKADLGLAELLPVHRLDKVTSGLLLFAKRPEVAAVLADQFREHRIEKYYIALSDRKPRKKQGTISGDMVKSRRSSWRLTQTRVRPAVTQFFSCAAAPGTRLYLLHPLTGKTHQLRVALKSIGAPILGDPLYGEQGSEDRTYLHAYSLGFQLRGRWHRYLCPPTIGQRFDESLNQLLSERFAEPWLQDWPKR
ncbi:TIGR01621 family pseudouridine synthase [Marinobacterium jannaschii]|uniref:TIGR01621 family pseudouridine synthase n=1 Tax=Marinobacterium jannaschii TaxID=64970 RepID=UPI000482D603|nr:TIGR01621 family pseudouridine synthase [Marinobacterium jannaschii]